MTKKTPKKTDRPGVDRMGRTLLHYAANEGRDKDVAQLLKDGVDPNAKDDSGWTPLHFAAQANALQISEMLLASGAEIDPLDSNGNTPLSTAVFACVGDGSLIAALRKAGADPFKENNYGVSPVGLARDISNFDIAQFFADLP